MLSKWDLRFLKLVNEVASWSKDPSTQVGSVIADGKHLVSVGFNGFPKGMRDDEHLYERRDFKYERTIHAEVNAILNARRSVEGFTLYVNRPPCVNCSLYIIQSGIKRVVAETDWLDADFMKRWGDSRQKALSFFVEAGVEYVD